MIPRTPLTIAIAVGVAVGATAPRLFGPHDRAPSEPFAYAPPAGFVESDAAKQVLDGSVAGGQRVWIRPIAGPTTQHVPNVSLVHTTKSAPADDAALAALAAGMPAVFAASGTEWRELRHAMHARPDGARVGLLEGAARAKSGGDPYRVIQIAFPESAGTAIVTASFPEDGAAEYEKELDASIDDARGVAFVAPPTPAWWHLAWGLGAGVVALAVGIAASRAGGAKRAEAS